LGFFIYTKKNTLKHVRAPYVFRVKYTDMTNENDFVDELARNHTTITAADAAGCQKAEREVIAKLLEKGGKVNLSWCSIYVTASGTAERDDEQFTPGRKNHAFDIHVIVNDDFRKEVADNISWVHAERLENTYPVITKITNLNGKSIRKLQQGDPLSVKGRRLLFDHMDQRQGIFFISRETGTAVRADIYNENDNRTVSVDIPKTLPDGLYTVQLLTPKTGCEGSWSAEYDDFIEISHT
jgi:hypothetical protein